MKSCVHFVVVCSLLGLAIECRAASSRVGPEPVQAARAQEPPGWAEAKSKAAALRREGRDLEIVAMFEQWVAKHPTFAEAYFRLGDAHTMVAFTAFSRGGDPKSTQAKHLEAAVAQMRRGLEVARGQVSFETMRSFIDLHGSGGVDRPAEYERLARAAVAQYPAEPLAHAYMLNLLVKRGEPIDAAMRAALAAIPKGPEARVALAEGLVDFVQRVGSRPPVQEVLLPEASRLVDEVLKLEPGDPSALKVKARIEKVQPLPDKNESLRTGMVKGVLRGIASAQATFSSVCGGYHYAPTLAALAKPPRGQTDGFINPDNVPLNGAKVLEKYRYCFEMTAPPSPDSPASCNGVPAGGLARTFSVTARPMGGFIGPSFQMNDEGRIVPVK